MSSVTALLYLFQTFTQKVHGKDHLHRSHKKRQTKEPTKFPDFVAKDKVHLISKYDTLCHMRDRVMF